MIKGTSFAFLTVFDELVWIPSPGNPESTFPVVIKHTRSGTIEVAPDRPTLEVVAEVEHQCKQLGNVPPGALLVDIQFLPETLTPARPTRS